MKKVVGLAYCGGCNAGYDRVEFVNTLFAAARAAGVEIELVAADAPCDIALIMAGCQALCVADRQDFGGQAGVRHVIGPEKLDAVSLPFDAIHTQLLAELTEKR